MDTYKSNFTALLISVALSIIQFCLYAWVIFDFFKILPRFLETNVLQNNINKLQIKTWYQGKVWLSPSIRKSKDS